jgi:hypothetical protein
MRVRLWEIVWRVSITIAITPCTTVFLVTTRRAILRQCFGAYRTLLKDMGKTALSTAACICCVGSGLLVVGARRHVNVLGILSFAVRKTDPLGLALSFMVTYHFARP